VGIDLGLTHFAVLSDGRKIASPRFLRRAERKLRKAQQDLSRKKTGSANRAKVRVRIARIHAHVAADSCRDWLQRKPPASSARAKRSMWRTCASAAWRKPRLAKSVHDAGWSAACGVKDGPKPLSVGEWTFGRCGTVHDRDVDAARNIVTA
jgi:putative transposase